MCGFDLNGSEGLQVGEKTNMGEGEKEWDQRVGCIILSTEATIIGGREVRCDGSFARKKKISILYDGDIYME